MTDVVKDVIVPVLSIIASMITAYFTAVYITRREMALGKARLLDICYRYILNFVNAFDRSTLTIRTDPLSYVLYVDELSKIVDDLDKLLGNAYAEKLILKHPRVAKLLVILRRELNEHKATGQYKLMGMNLDSIREIFELMHIVRKDLGRSAPNTDFDREIEAVEQALRKAWGWPPGDPDS